MDHDREQELAQVDDATRRLMATLAELDDDGVRQPSLLPGWTRGHVITHVARSADAMSRLLAGAAAGLSVPAYASAEAREAEIAEGADRPAALLAADVATSAARFREQVRELDAAAWAVEVRVSVGGPVSASRLLVRRLAEVELHHVDLGLGYTPADWPASFRALALPEPVESQRRDRLARAASG
jgi:maleylpyruvate isomerase